MLPEKKTKVLSYYGPDKSLTDEDLTFRRIAEKARLIPNLPQPVDKTIDQLAKWLRPPTIASSGPMTARCGLRSVKPTG